MDGVIVLQIWHSRCDYSCSDASELKERKRNPYCHRLARYQQSIVDLHAVCGSLSDAYKLFDGLRPLKMGVDRFT